MSCAHSLSAQAVFRSSGSGSWTAPSTWTLISGSTLTGVPTSIDSVEIAAGHTVTMNGSPGAAFQLTVNGTASWSGAITTNIGAGGISFNPGSDATGTAAGFLTTAGGLTLNSMLSSTGVTVQLITTAGQTIAGTGSLARLSLNVAATNTGELTVRSTLAGAGTLTNGTSAVIRFYGASISAPLNLAAVPNTVVYGASGGQAIAGGSYYHLVLAGSGAKTWSPNCSVNGDFTIRDTAYFQFTGSAKNLRFYGDIVLESVAPTLITSNLVNNKWFFRAPAVNPRPTGFKGPATGTITMGEVSFENRNGFSSAQSLNIKTSLTIDTLLTFTPAPTAVIGGTGSLSGRGRYVVTRDLAPTDGFAAQYPFASVNLTQCTVEYASDNTQTITAGNYKTLVSSGAGQRILPSSGTIAVSGSFAPGTNAYTTAGSTVAFTGSTGQNIPAFDYNNLTVSGKAADTLVSLDGPVSVAGTFTATGGKLQTNGHPFTVTNSAAGALVLNGTRVTGSVTRAIESGSSLPYAFTDSANVIIPDGSQGPVTVVVTSIPGGVPPDPVVPMVNRAYRVDVNGALSGSARFPYLVSELNGLDEPTLTGFVKRPEGWEVVPTSIDTANHRAMLTPGTVWSDFGLGNITLQPHTVLSGFNASAAPESGGVYVQWSTSSETSNAGFVVERHRADSSVFYPVSGGSLPGTGTSILPHAYEFYDVTVPLGFFVYRVRQTDADLTTQYTAEVQVTVLNSRIDGTGVLVSAEVDPGAIEFDLVRVGSFRDSSITVRNAGIDSLRISAIVASDPAYTVTPTSATVPPRDSLTVAVRFSPAISGPAAALLVLTSNAPTSPDTVSLSGTGARSEFRLDPGAVQFGAVRVGGSRDTIVTIENTGNDTLWISSAMSSTPAFEIRSGGTVVPPGWSVVDTVRFAPASEGVIEGYVLYSSNAAAAGDTLWLGGFGAVYSFSVSSDTIDLGSVPIGQAKDTTLVIMNTGNDTLQVSSISPGDNIFSVSAGSCALAPAQALSDTIRFSPTAPGPVSRPLVILSNAFSSPDTVWLTGTGTPLTGVSPGSDIPREFALWQNYPNPFNPSTTIRFGLPHRASVSLAVYNTVGQLVATLLQGEQDAGYHDVVFDASALASGVYLFRLRAGEFVQTRKLVLAR